MKKIIIIPFISILFSFSLFAQFAVLDFPNLLQSIENVYNSYQQINNQIEQVRKAAEHVENTYKQMMEMNWDDLNNLGDNFSGMGENPFEVITGVYKSSQDITRAVNKNMNKVNDFTDSIMSDTALTIGGKKFSFWDMSGTVIFDHDRLLELTNAMTDQLEQTFTDPWDHWVEGLTYDQRVAVANRFGMSARNYANYNAANSTLKDLVGSKQAYNLTVKGQQEQLNKIKAEANVISTMAENLPEGSVYAANQAMIKSLAKLSEDIGTMQYEINQMLATQIAQQAALTDIDNIKEREKKEQEEELRKATQNQGIDYNEFMML